MITKVIRLAMQNHTKEKISCSKYLSIFYCARIHWFAFSPATLFQLQEFAFSIELNAFSNERKCKKEFNTEKASIVKAEKKDAQRGN